MLFCTGLLFLATQLPGAHWNLEGQSTSDGVQNMWAVMGRGRGRLGTSCQIIPFCWTQPRSVTSRCGVTIQRPLPCWLGCGESPSPQLHLVKVLLWRLPVSCTLGSNDCNGETDFWEKGPLSQGQGSLSEARRVGKLSLLMTPAPSY